MISFSVEENFFFYSKSSRYGGSLLFKVGVVAPLDKETGMVGNLPFLQKILKDFKTTILGREALPFNIKILLLELSQFLKQQGIPEDSQQIEVSDRSQNIFVVKNNNKISQIQIFELFTSESIPESLQFETLKVEVSNFLMHRTSFDLATLLSKENFSEEEVTKKIRDQLDFLKDEIGPLPEQFYWRFDRANGRFLEKSI